MVIIRAASAGSLESNDLLVQVAPGENGREIRIKSPVLKLFRGRIQDQAELLLDEMDIHDVIIDINDMGALDFVIRARIETALMRTVG